MSDNETQKTSDEILYELFNSLNLPVSPNAEKCVTHTCATVKFSPDSAQASKKLSKKKRNSNNNSESDHAHSQKVRKKSTRNNSKDEAKRSRSQSYSRSISRSRSTSKSKSYHSKSSRSRGSSKYTSSLYSSKDRSRSSSKSKYKTSRSRSSSRHRRSHSGSHSRHSYRSNSRSTSRYRYSRSRSKSRYRRSRSHSRSKSRDRRNIKNSHSSHQKRNHNYKSDSTFRYNRSTDSSDNDYYHNKKKPRRRSYSKSPPHKKTRSPTLEIKTKDPLDVWRQTKLAKLKLNSTNSQKDVKNGTDDKEIEEITLIEESQNEDSSKHVINTTSKETDYATEELSNDNIAEQKTSHSEETSNVNLIEPPDSKFVPLPIIEPSDDVEAPSKSCNAVESKSEDTSADWAKDQDKPKCIVIKSLKDSQVLQQAVEEAKKKPMDETQTSTISNTLNDKEVKAIEEGEVLSEEDSKKKEKEKSKSKKKSHSKSKDRNSSREKESRHKSSKSDRSNRRRRSRSRSKHRHRSRSRSSERKSYQKDRKKSSRSQHSVRTRSTRSPDCVDSLRDKATRKRLLEIARKNAVYLMKNNCLPPSIERESLKATGKSVEELTNFCKQLVTKGDYSDADLSDPSFSEEEVGEEAPFSGGRHPFAIKDSKPILMNIRNAPMLPTKTNAERLADTSKLREQFPVSSGSQHRTKESEWVPVQKEEKEKIEPEPVFELPKAQFDISQVVSTRVSAMRRLQDNPEDRDAILALSNAQMDMENWVLSKQVPGQFMGTTGARILSQEELSSGYQAWARKEKLPQTVYEAMQQEAHLQEDEFISLNGIPFKGPLSGRLRSCRNPRGLSPWAECHLRAVR